MDLRELRPLIGTRVFGCDACQDICPFNRGKVRGDIGSEPASGVAPGQVDLRAWLQLSSSGYRRLTAGTALGRASRWQLLRNAAVAAGNSGEPALIEPLSNLLLNSKYPIVRGHSAWALGRFGVPSAAASLSRARTTETDVDVISEIDQASSDWRSRREP